MSLYHTVYRTMIVPRRHKYTKLVLSLLYRCLSTLCNLLTYNEARASHLAINHGNPEDFNASELRDEYYDPESVQEGFLSDFYRWYDHSDSDCKDPPDVAESDSSSDCRGALGLNMVIRVRCVCAVKPLPGPRQRSHTNLLHDSPREALVHVRCELQRSLAIGLRVRA